ncbi:hypothetical protein ACOCJ7_09560 [Knoellia sp. CPCC 206453]|uniref:hypothetical protein n=1 Tax=Knoellia pratensis TaxID=3404796 RepID=UPI00360AE658
MTILGTGRHSAMGAARVENVLLHCTADSATAQLALSTVTSCLTEMAQAVPFAAEQHVAITDANRLVATKMLLVKSAGQGQSVSVRENRSPSQPCASSSKTFLPGGTAIALLQTEVPSEVEDPSSAEAPQYLGVVSAEGLADTSSAKAKVAQARATFGGCKGRYTRSKGTHVATGKVTGITDSALGDGGFTITATSQYTGQSKPETVQQSIFSVGPFVVELYGASTKDAAAIADRLKAVARS